MSWLRKLWALVRRDYGELELLVRERKSTWGSEPADDRYRPSGDGRGWLDSGCPKKPLGEPVNLHVVALPPEPERVVTLPDFDPVADIPEFLRRSK